MLPKPSDTSEPDNGEPAIGPFRRAYTS
jgi:hypothetical protein